MSMSSLSAQLASLHSQSTKNPGSTFSSSKRHEDATGRGLYHSVQQGFSVTNVNNAKFKPSILYEDAKAASDVPLTTVRESALSSLQNLTQYDDFTFLFDIHSLRKERQLLTMAENRELDEKIDVFLAWVGIVMGEPSPDSLSSCLHILEYMLRRHEVHIRNAQSLLLYCGLPHHDQPYFVRLLQLIDLANMPEFVFLRPYAVQSKKGTTPTQPPTRTAIAKRVSQDRALLKLICRLATQSMKAPTSGGASQVMSFACALLVEAMALQARKNGSLEETTVRILLPLILKACRGDTESGDNNPEWMGFGHVLATFLVEHCELGTDAMETLATAIVKPLSNHSDQQEASVLVDVVVTLMAVLPNAQKSSTNIPLIPGVKGIHCYGLSEKTFTRLKQHPTLIAKLLGSIYQDRQLHVAPMIMTLWSKSLEDKARNNDAMLTQLLTEPSLRDVWEKSQRLVAPCSASLIEPLLSTKSGSKALEKRCKRLLSLLKSIHLDAWNVGVAHAVTKLQAHDMRTKQRVARVLGEKVNATKHKSKEDEGQSVSMLLPPRVALEHADAEVRIEAMDRLLKSTKDDGDDGFGSALVRRIRMEDDVAVAFKAAEASYVLLQSNRFCFTHAICDTLLSSMHKWSSPLVPLGKKSKRNKKVVKLFGVMLKLAAAAIQWMQLMLISSSETTNVLNSTGQRILQEIVGYLYHDEASSRDSASDALCMALEGNTKSEAKELVISNEHIIALLRTIKESSSDEDDSFTEIQSRQCFLLTIARSITEHLQSHKEGTLGVARNGIDSCLTFLKNGNTLSENNAAILLKCIELSVPHLPVEEMPEIIVSLAGIQEPNAFMKVSRPSLVVCLKSADTRRKDKNEDDGVSSTSVLMGTATRPNLATLQVMRLLEMAKESPLNIDPVSALVPALALLGHTDQKVRKASLELFVSLKTQSRADKGNAAMAHLCTILSDDKKNTEGTSTALIMDGVAALPHFLNSAVSTATHQQQLRELILTQCVSVATKTLSSSLDKSIGGTHAAATVLSAAEFAGEKAFPLLDRWTLSGKVLLKKLLRLGEEQKNEPVVVTSVFHALISTVLRMMKGAMVHDASSLHGKMSSMVVVAFGPGPLGTRGRSYSVGQTSGVSFVDEYPNDMVVAICDCLSKMRLDSLRQNPVLQDICSGLVEDVMGRKSWVDGVFQNMTREDRISIASGLLELHATSVVDGASVAFFGLPLDATDVCHFVHAKIEDLSSSTLIMDYVCENSARLSASKNAADLISALFKFLSELSLAATMYVDESEYTRHSVLRSLVSIFCALPKTTTKVKKPKVMTEMSIVSSTTLLVRLVGGSSSSDREETHRAMLSWRGKKLALVLLTGLCPLDPSSVVHSLIPALVSSTISSDLDEFNAQVNMSAIKDAFVAVVPVFYEHSASAGLSMFDLFSVFLKETAKVTVARVQRELCQAMVDALVSISLSLVESGPLGFFLVSLLSFNKENEEVASTLLKVSEVAALVEEASSSTKVLTILQITDFCRRLMNLVDSASSGDDGDDVEQEAVLEPLLKAIGLEGAGGNIDKLNSDDATHVFGLVNKMAKFVLGCLMHPGMGMFARMAHANDAEICLRLWQELLILQTTALGLELDEPSESTSKLCDICRKTINECLMALQALLPVHLFLASTAALVEDDSNPELRSRVLRFLAERVKDVEPASPEASLFLDQLTMLVEIMDPRDGNNKNLIVLQSSSLVVEQMARAFGFIDNLSTKHADSFFDSLRVATKSLDLFSKSLKTCNAPWQDARIQVSCTLALCISTLVRLLKARSLPILPQLMGGLLGLLQLTGDSGEEAAQELIPMVRLSMIRALTAVVDTLPQFLVPYLDQLVSNRVLMHAGDELPQTLARKTPARQLVPAVRKAISKEAQSHSAFLPILKECIKVAPRAELSGVHSQLLQCLLESYSMAVDNDDLLDAVNTVLLDWVLRMSEAQLRPLYSKLREWKEENEELRQKPFWSLSSVLARELKIIFLASCLSVDDLLPPLEKAVAVMAPTSSNKNKKNKKAKLVANNVTSLQYLPALLACLTHSLRADARRGGEWCRGEERYPRLMEPLAKLLQCRVPDEFFSSSRVDHHNDHDVSPYQRLVVKTDNDSDDLGGTVMACLVALALAAGQETLWKPLNHEVLQACGNEDRTEIRKAGVALLLGLIKALGEEYMVLLPECLPYLSELMESDDEETVAMAQECVSLSENLLGESLQDSLR